MPTQYLDMFLHKKLFYTPEKTIIEGMSAKEFQKTFDGKGEEDIMDITS